MTEFPMTELLLSMVRHFNIMGEATIMSEVFYLLVVLYSWTICSSLFPVTELRKGERRVVYLQARGLGGCLL